MRHNEKFRRNVGYLHSEESVGNLTGAKWLMDKSRCSCSDDQKKFMGEKNGSTDCSGRSMPLHSSVQTQLCTCGHDSKDKGYKNHSKKIAANRIILISNNGKSKLAVKDSGDSVYERDDNFDDIREKEFEIGNVSESYWMHCITNRTATADIKHLRNTGYSFSSLTSGDESRSTHERKLHNRSNHQHLVASVPCSKLTSYILALITVLQIVSCSVAAHVHRGIDMCEPIEIPMCAGMPYNMTRMPNHLHHSTQENARLAIEPYGELVSQNCSADLLFFICAMFAPICTPHFQRDAIPPCRSVCERSRRGCEPVMNKYNFSWPEDLNCDRLPEYDKGVCVSPEAIVSSMPEENNGDTQTEAPKRKPKTDCKCSKRSKPNKSAFKTGKYHYAIQALVKSITIINENTSVIRVLVNSILKRGKVHIQDNRHIDLWVNTDCVCPSLRPHKEYLIVGHENVMYNKLNYGQDSLVTRWRQKWVKKFKGWERKRKSKKKECKNKNSKRCKNKKNKSKSRRRCKNRVGDDTKTRAKCRRRKSDRNKSRQKNRNSIKRKNTGNEGNQMNTVTNKAGR